MTENRFLSTLLNLTLKCCPCDTYWMSASFTLLLDALKNRHRMASTLILVRGRFSLAYLSPRKFSCNFSAFI